MARSIPFATHKRLINLLDFDPDIEEIAYALARIKRFNGYGSVNVAQHSLAVHDALEAMGAPAMVCFQGFMHDSHEAYFGDISSSVKQYVRSVEIGLGIECIDSSLDEAERRLQNRVLVHFGIPTGIFPEVTAVDRLCGEFEGRATVEGYLGYVGKAPGLTYGPDVWEKRFMDAFRLVKDRLEMESDNE